MAIILENARKEHTKPGNRCNVVSFENNSKKDPSSDKFIPFRGSIVPITRELENDVIREAFFLEHEPSTALDYDALLASEDRYIPTFDGAFCGPTWGRPSPDRTCRRTLQGKVTIRLIESKESA